MSVPSPLALVRLDPDDDSMTISMTDSMTTVAEWPRLTHSDVFAMSPDLGARSTSSLRARAAARMPLCSSTRHQGVVVCSQNWSGLVP